MYFILFMSGWRGWRVCVRRFNGKHNKHRKRWWSTCGREAFQYTVSGVLATSLVLLLLQGSFPLLLDGTYTALNIRHLAQVGHLSSHEIIYKYLDKLFHIMQGAWSPPTISLVQLTATSWWPQVFHRQEFMSHSVSLKYNCNCDSNCWCKCKSLSNCNCSVNVTVSVSCLQEATKEETGRLRSGRSVSRRPKGVAAIRYRPFPNTPREFTD